MRWRQLRGRENVKLVCENRRQVFGFATKGVSSLEKKDEKKKIIEYAEMVKRLSPKSDMAKGICRAFVVGGLICMLGQGFHDLFAYGLKWGAQSSCAAASICLIFLSALLTGIGVYDRIGKFAGAGSIVPITGFANSLVIS